jgi:hypothetical protein
MKNNITIGIEGLVGAGKTSICRELLDLIPNSIILHGGNLYRGIVYALATSGIDFKNVMHNKEAMQHLDIKQLMEKLQVELKIENRESVVYIAGKKIDEDSLQSDENSIAVSTIAKDADNAKFYAFGKMLIDMYKSQFNLIISGRDLMKIYPELDYHFFIIADLDARVERKAKQYTEYEKADADIKHVSKKELRKHIETRDKLQEEAGFYKRYSITQDIDVTDCKNARESALKVMEKIAQ